MGFWSEKKLKSVTLVELNRGFRDKDGDTTNYLKARKENIKDIS